MELDEQVEMIQTRSDFVAFVRAIRRDLQEYPESWENLSLDRYLEALAAWTEDMDGYFLNIRGESVHEQPSWRTLGYILLAARTYE